MKKVVRGLAVISVVFALYVGLLLFLAGKQSDYRVVFSTDREEYVFSNADAEEYCIDVTVQNKANRLLRSADEIYLSYHLYDRDGTVLAYDNNRSELPKPLFSGDHCVVPMHLTYLEPGEYVIGIDMLQENVTWFSVHEDIEKKIRVITK